MVRFTGGTARRWGPILALLVSLATAIALVSPAPPARADPLAFAITSQPASTTGNQGGAASLSVAVSGGVTPYHYQWQYDDAGTWKPVPSTLGTGGLTGATTATLRFSNLSSETSTYPFRVIVTDASTPAASVTSNQATVTVAPPLVITNQPVDVTNGVLGGTASLSVVASGGTEPLSYQWQIYEGGDWFDVSGSSLGTRTIAGARTDTLRFSNLPAYIGAYQFRAIVTAGDVSVTSDSVTVSLAPASLAITSQPVNTTGVVGGSVDFKVTASTTNNSFIGNYENITYTWQYYDGADWQDADYAEVDRPGVVVGNIHLPTLTLTGLPLGMDGARFRAIVTSTNIGAGVPVTSNEVTLTVTPALVVSGPDNDGAEEGGSATFTVETASSVNGYQWQYFDGSSWTDLADGPLGDASVAGSNGPTLTFTNLTAALNQTRIRVHVSADTPPATATSGEALLSVGPLPVIATAVVQEDHPVVGGTAHLHATLAAPTPGLPLTWTWQVLSIGSFYAGDSNFGSNSNSPNFHFRRPLWTTIQNGPDVSGARTPTLTLRHLTPDMGRNNTVYRVVVSNGVGSDTWGDFPYFMQLDIGVSPHFTSQPENETAVSGAASFTASATGEPVPDTYRWQVSTDGTDWTDLSDATTGVSGSDTDTLSLTGLTLDDNSNLYRLKAWNAQYPTDVGTSEAATLTVENTPLTITNPADVTATRLTPSSPTANATITATTGGEPVATEVVWQWRIPGETAPWQPLSAIDVGVTPTPQLANPTATLGLTGLTSAQNGYRFRAIATRPGGTANDTATSDSMTLTVGTAPTTTNPSNTTAIGGAASFAVDVTGVPAPTVVWERRLPPAVSWTPVSGGTISGGTATLSLAGLLPADNGYEYHAVVTNSEDSKTSQPATLTVGAAPTVSDPLSQTAVSGAAAFTATVTGTPLPTVAWQQLAPTVGAVWESAGNGTISGATATLSLTGLTSAKNGYRYRAVVTNSSGSATSDSAALTIGTAPTVSDPAGKTAIAGAATFTATVTGDPTPTVLWQRRSPSSPTWESAGAGTLVSGLASLPLTSIGSGLNGYRYRAVVTNALGSATSDSAILTVGSAPDVSNPLPQAAVNHSATFTATVTGTPTPTVKWQSLATTTGARWADLTASGTVVMAFTSGTATLTLSGLSTGNSGTRYRVVASNGIDPAAVSDSALLTVSAAAPSFTLNPVAVTTSGTSASFTVAVAGEPAPTVQWQSLAPITGAQWTNVAEGAVTGATASGTTSTTLVLTALTAARSGYRYRAVATNGVTPAATSTTALLTIGAT